MNEMRLCNRCNIEKHESLFYKYSGLQSLMRRCKECDNNLAKKYAKNNRAKINSSRKIHYNKNIEKFREKDRNRYWNNPKRRAYTLNNHKIWAAKNPRLKRDLILKRTYGISIDQWEEMSLKQNHACAICHKKETLVRYGSLCSLVVDHCHATGKVRGLLCNNCNRMMGMLKDNVETLKRMIDYLTQYEPL